MRKLSLIAIIGITLAGLSMSLTALAAGGQSITRTFQPSAADSWLDQKNDTTNYGSDTTMTVDSHRLGVSRNGRAVVQFDISQIPTGSTVSSATLSLYASAVPASTRTYYAHVITTSWAEGTVTWNTPWTTPGGDSNASTVSATTPGSAGWMNFDVTSDVSSFVNGTANYGWLIKDGTEDSGTEYITTFYTKEEGTQTTLRPKLSVTFTALWDSYGDTARSSQIDTFTDSYGTVYMKGTGFLDGSNTYDTGYYDAGGTLITTDNNIALVSVSGGRGTLGNTADPYEPNFPCNTDSGALSGSGWHAVVQPSTATAFPNSYSTLSASPDTYQLIADDTFTVSQDVIPEFPTVMAAIGVAGVCLGIYWWMRRRKLGICQGLKSST